MTEPLRLPATFSAGPVALRLPTADDVDRVHEICQDPDIQRFTRVPVPYRREDAEEWVGLATTALAEGRGAHLVVEEDGVVVGAVGGGIDTTDQVGVVGYWTAPEARGRGLTTGAMRRLCRWMIEDLGLPRLELDAAASNGPSNGVAAALGFTHEGTGRDGMLLSAVGDLPSVRDDKNLWGLLADELD